MNDKFADYIRKKLREKISKKSQGIIYKYLGEQEKSIGIFQSLTDVINVSSRFDVDGLSEKDKKDVRALIDIGKHFITFGIEFNLARKNPEKSKQLFVWASENCFVPADTFKEWLDIGDYSEIAVGFLWRGYALLMLGKYEEAYELLGQVPVYFNKSKLSGSDVWQVDEPKLVKALLPLCEYKLYPTEENREKARKGIEDYIKSYREPKFKLEGYLYYYHLKEMFPEVYSGKPCAEKPIEKTPMGHGVERVGRPVSASDILKDIKYQDDYDPARDVVTVHDTYWHKTNDFGSPLDLLEYVDKINGIGGYSALSGLVDEYAVEETAGLEPQQLIREGERLLAVINDPWLKAKTELILEVAYAAIKEDAGVTLSME